MATSLKMVLKMALLLIVIASALGGNTNGIEGPQEIKDRTEYPSSNSNNFNVEKFGCCNIEPLCCPRGLRNL
ncbi:hypothetical protein MTR_1g076630 [Medicago truncatula]|uniref:Transmembrane protein n=1 Tax=Medicago truncatula TaxID=3880 RepID=A0A072VLV7_MEDTR|nr:hypothetical protein MTR_1g076630 [Medicago truncatula]